MHSKVVHNAKELKKLAALSWHTNTGKVLWNTYRVV